MKLYLMRHASVEEKYTGCYNGHIDILLSVAGVSEAKDAASRLLDIEFDAVYCSDLMRCRQSVEPFRFDGVVYDERLREKSWGRAEGMRFEDICATFELVYEDFESFVRAVGGESIEDFDARVGSFFNELKCMKTSNILVVTHGGVIKNFLAKQNELSLEEAFGLDVPYGTVITIEDFV